MKIKQPMTERVFLWVINVILFCIMFICLYPMVHILAASLSDSSLIAAHRGLLFFPKGLFRLRNDLKHQSGKQRFTAA